MNRTIKRKQRGSITQRSADSLSIIVYAGTDPATNKPRQLWETVKRLPDETDAQLRDRAERRLGELLRKHDEGANIIAERLTVERYLSEWLDAYASDHPESTTPQTYRYVLEGHVIPRIGHVLLPRLTAKHVEGIYREMRNAGLSGETRAKVHRTLSQVLKRAVRDGNLPRNVCDSVDASLYKPTKPTLHKITVDEAARLVDAAKAYSEIAALIPLMAYSGLRLGEALGLRWSDVDFDGDELRIVQTRKKHRDRYLRYGTPKTEQSARTVPMMPIVSTALYEHRERQRKHYEKHGLAPEHELVFTRADGSPYDHDNVTHRWQRIRETAKVPKARLHDLRHFAASTMADHGAPVHHVAAVLGHSQVTTTYNRYYRSNEDDKRRAIDAFAKVLAELGRTSAGVSREQDPLL